MKFLAIVLAALPISLLAAAKENPKWPRHVIAEGFMCQTAIAHDFSGDGLPDVIADGGGDTRLFVAPDWKEIVLDKGHDTIHSEVLDVDGDGDADYIGAVYSPGPIFWLEQPDEPLAGAVAVPVGGRQGQRDAWIDHGRHQPRRQA